MIAAIGLALLSALGFAGGSILIRLGVQQVYPPAATFIGVVAGAVLICSIAFSVNLPEIKRLSLVNLGWITLMGILAYPMARVFMHSAIAIVGATRSLPVSSVQPLIAFAIAVALLGERPNLLVTVGTPVIVAGLLLVVMPRSGGPTADRLDKLKFLGYMLALGGAASFATRDVISRHLVSGDLPPFVASGFALAIGGTILFALARRRIVHSLRNAPPRYLGYCLLAGMLQGMAVAALFHALSRAPVTVISPIHASQPIIVLALAWLFLKQLEKVDSFLIIGTLLSVGGVILVILGAAS